MLATIFIVTYIILCLTVIVLVLSIVNLYRRAADEPLSLDDAWPFAGLVPGQALPWSEYSSGDGQRLPESGLFLLTVPEVDSAAEIFSAAILARAWGCPATLLVRSPGIRDWPALAALNRHVLVAHIPDEQIERYAPASFPILVLAQHGFILSATSHAKHPTSLVV